MGGNRAKGEAISRPALLNGVELSNQNDPIYLVSDKCADMELALREYEIENTVCFVKGTAHRRHFNKNYVPWEEEKHKKRGPMIRFFTKTIPKSSKPIVFVGSTIVGCRFGTQRHKEVKGDQHGPSCKIGCTAKVQIDEVIRIDSPCLSWSYDDVTDYHKESLSSHIRKLMRGIGDLNAFRWRREFHMIIPPLAIHAHVTGLEAGPQMLVDAEIKNRIKDLARSGITGVAIIRQNLNHYVETVMFTGRQPPPQTNRRFYPTTRDILNHVFLAKEQDRVMSAAAKAKPDESLGSDDERSPVDANLQDGDDDITELASTAKELKGDHPTASTRCYLTCPNTSQVRYLGEEVFIETSETSMDDTSHLYYEDTPSTRKGSESLRVVPHRYHKLKGHKESCQFLLKQLNKIYSVVENEDGFRTLAAQLVNVILEVKSFIPKEKMAYVYKSELKTVTRRLRQHRHKPKLAAPRIKLRTPEDRFQSIWRSKNHWSKAYQTAAGISQFLENDSYGPTKSDISTRDSTKNLLTTGAHTMRNIVSDTTNHKTEYVTQNPRETSFHQTSHHRASKPATTTLDKPKLSNSVCIATPKIKNADSDAGQSSTVNTMKTISLSCPPASSATKVAVDWPSSSNSVCIATDKNEADSRTVQSSAQNTAKPVSHGNSYLPASKSVAIALDKPADSESIQPSTPSSVKAVSLLHPPASKAVKVAVDGPKASSSVFIATSKNNCAYTDTGPSSHLPIHSNTCLSIRPVTIVSAKGTNSSECKLPNNTIETGLMGEQTSNPSDSSVINNASRNTASILKRVAVNHHTEAGTKKAKTSKTITLYISSPSPHSNPVVSQEVIGPAQP